MLIDLPGNYHQPPESMIGVLAMFWTFGRLMSIVTHGISFEA
jgi:hypothetical protein